jgi:hypothetical protein
MIFEIWQKEGQETPSLTVERAMGPECTEQVSVVSVTGGANIDFRADIQMNKWLDVDAVTVRAL